MDELPSRQPGALGRVHGDQCRVAALRAGQVQGRRHQAAPPGTLGAGGGGRRQATCSTSSATSAWTPCRGRGWGRGSRGSISPRRRSPWRGRSRRSCRSRPGSSAAISTTCRDTWTAGSTSSSPRTGCWPGFPTCAAGPTWWRGTCGPAGSSTWRKSIPRRCSSRRRSPGRSGGSGTTTSRKASPSTRTRERIPTPTARVENNTVARVDAPAGDGGERAGPRRAAPRVPARAPVHRLPPVPVPRAAGRHPLVPAGGNAAGAAPVFAARGQADGGEGRRLKRMRDGGPESWGA